MRHRRSKRGKVHLPVFCACLLFATAFTISCRATRRTAVAATTQDAQHVLFADGVYIDSTYISGMTLQDAKELLQGHADYFIQNIAITLACEALPQNVRITASDINASTNLDAVLHDALLGGAGQLYHTELSFDAAALEARLNKIAASLSTAPTDAAVSMQLDESGKPVFHYAQGTDGFSIDIQKTAALIRDALTQKKYQTTIAPVLIPVPHETTVNDLETNTALIGSFTTTYNYKGTAESTEQERELLIPNRAYNVEKCAEMLNGIIVKPGKTFSFNKAVGDRTEANGWRQANGIFGGDRFTLQYGGGVCQVSTTLYNALLQCYPNISILHRQKHSIPSSYVDLGLDATVDSGHIDFTFKNVSDAPLYLFASYSTNKWATNRRRDLTILVYGKALPEGTVYQTRVEKIEELLPGEPVIEYDKQKPADYEEVTVQARNGYVVDVYLDRIVNGELAETVFICTDTYEAKTEKRIVGTKPLATPTPTSPAVSTANPAAHASPSP